MTQSPPMRASRAIDIVGIVWGVASLIFFNFFSDYIAFYHDGIREPFITAEFNKWLWIHNPMLVLMLIRHSISLVFKGYIFRRSILIFLALMGVASTSTLLIVFPFDFSILPDANAVKWSELGLKIALVLTIVMFSIEALIGIIKSFRKTVSNSDDVGSC